MTYRLVESAQDRNVLLRLLDEGHIDVADQAELIRLLCAKIDRLDGESVEAQRRLRAAYKAELDGYYAARAALGHGAG